MDPLLMDPSDRDRGLRWLRTIRDQQTIRRHQATRAALAHATTRSKETQ